MTGLELRVGVVGRGVALCHPQSWWLAHKMEVSLEEDEEEQKVQTDASSRGMDEGRV